MFCFNCGKEIRQGANFCMYCGTPVGDIANDETTKDERCADVVEEDYSNGDYSNCENGKVSFPKMFRKFFSKNIKEYFSFKGTYSRLEYFYARSIIYIAILSVIVPCMAVPNLYMLIAVPITVAFIWLLAASYVKRLKDLNVTLWVMLIPPICGLFIRRCEDCPIICTIATIIFIYYKACVLFVQGDKFKEKVEKEKNDEESDESDCKLSLIQKIFILITSLMLLPFISSTFTSFLREIFNIY